MPGAVSATERIGCETLATRTRSTLEWRRPITPIPGLQVGLDAGSPLQLSVDCARS